MCNCNGPTRGPKPGPAQVPSGCLKIWEPGIGTLESNIIQEINNINIKICVAQNVSKLCMSRKTKTTRLHFMPFQAMFATDRKNQKYINLFLFFHNFSAAACLKIFLGSLWASQPPQQCGFSGASGLAGTPARCVFFFWWRLLRQQRLKLTWNLSRTHSEHILEPL